MSQLGSQRVQDVFGDCLFLDEEPKVDVVYAEGITNLFGFHPGRLASHRDEIRDMLTELPASFRVGGGGGWSFLNACQDRSGDLWTGEHRVVEQLLVLGIATGQARWLLPRHLWDALPGGMPYVRVEV